VPTALYVAAYVFGGYFTVKEAIENLRARRFEIDTLMLVAAAGAAALGQWAEGALLLFLFSLGHSLEHYAMGRARRAIEALSKLAPETATRRRDGGTEEVPLSQLEVGDVVVVRPNERLPADGVLVAGNTSVNQAPVTGESVPVDKRPAADPKAAIGNFDRAPAEHRVFAGTINGSGAVDVMVARKSDQSTMARVIKMVTEAEAQRSPTQQFTDKFERAFVPAVLALVGLLMFAWVVVDESFATSFYRAMAVLVAASPCALAISVPSAVLSGVASGARRRSGQGRRSAGEPGHADLHRLRQDRHPDRGQAAHDGRHRRRPGHRGGTAVRGACGGRAQRPSTRASHRVQVPGSAWPIQRVVRQHRM
jgi:Cd2+/Zn2+-exporting ATPase